jgi:hypothetical protein
MEGRRYESTKMVLANRFMRNIGSPINSTVIPSKLYSENPNPLQAQTEKRKDPANKDEEILHPVRHHCGLDFYFKGGNFDEKLNCLLLIPWHDRKSDNLILCSRGMGCPSPPQICLLSTSGANGDDNHIRRRKGSGDDGSRNHNRMG